MPGEKDDSFDEETWVNRIIKQNTEGFSPQPKPRNSLVVAISPKTKHIKMIQFSKRSMIENG